MNERSRFNHPDEVIAHASVRGGIELARVSEEERRELWDWYRSEFDSIDGPRRVELIEQFVGFGLVDSHQALAFAERLSPEERGSFGDYLGKTMDGTTHLRAFHECWNDLPEERKASYVRQFTKDEPERLAMVAPFMDVTKLSEGERLKLRSVLAEHAGSFDRFSELFGAVLDYEKRHPYVPPAIDRTRPYSEQTAMQNAQRSPADYLANWLKARADVMSMHLLPHAAFLIERGWMTREEAAAQLTKRHYAFQDLRSQREHDEVRRIHAEYRHAHPDEKIPERVEGYYGGSRSYRERIRELDRASKTRAVALISDGFNTVGGAVSRRAVLQSLCEQSLPWTEGAERMGATAEDILKTIEWGTKSGYGIFPEDDFPIERLLTHVRRSFPADASVVERAIVGALMAEQTDAGYDAPLASGFIRRFKENARLFSKENVRSILASIARRLPGILLLSPDAVTFARAEGIPFEPRSAINVTLHKNSQFFLLEFALLWKTVRESCDMTFSELREAFAGTIRHQPYLLFDKANAGAINDLVPASERVAVVEELVRTRKNDGQFLLSVLEQPSLGSLRAMALECLSVPAAFDSVMSHGYESERVIKAFGDDDRLFRVALNSNDAESAKHLAGFVAEYFEKNPRSASAWIRHLERIGATEAIASLEARLRGKGDKNALSLAHDAVVRACEREPRAAFDDSVLRLLGPEADALLCAHANLAVRCNPSLIFTTSISAESHRVLELALGSAGYEELLHASRHAIAFDRQTSIRAIGNRTFVGIVMGRYPLLFPFESLPSTSGEAFYEGLYERLSERAYFSEFEKSIRSHAAESMEFHTGEEFRFFSVPDQLWRDVMTVVLLNESIPAMRYEDEIRALPAHERSTLLSALATLVRYGRGDEPFDVSTESGRKEAMVAARETLSEISGLDLPDGIDRLPMETIQAQMTYFQRTVHKNPRMGKAFREYLGHVASDGFERWRNWGSEEMEPDGEPAALARMKAEGLVPMGTTLRQYRDWVRPETLDVREELSFSAGDVASGVRDILSQAISDGHLSAETAAIGPEQVEAELEQIERPMALWMAQIQLIDAKFARTRIERKAGVAPTMEPTEGDKEEYAELKARVRSYRGEHESRIRLLYGLQTINRMRHLTADELQGQVIEIEKKRIPWVRAFKEIFEGVVAAEPAFRTDAERLRSLLEDAHREVFGGGRVSRHELRLDDAIDPVALFHVGEKPVQSCQHWNGDGYFSVGLLSYQTDPNVRMIFMRDENAELVARAALRLLQREDGSPALLIERVYSANVHPKIKEMVVRLAKKKARTLGVPLYAAPGDQVADDESASAETARLESRGSRAAFVYTDAGGGRASQGVYLVENAIEVYKP